MARLILGVAFVALLAPATSTPAASAVGAEEDIRYVERVDLEFLVRSISESGDGRGVQAPPSEVWWGFDRSSAGAVTYADEAGLWYDPGDGTEPVLIEPRTGDQGPSGPKFSHGGDTLAFIRTDFGGSDVLSTLVLVDLPALGRSEFSIDGYIRFIHCGLAWTADDQEVLVSWTRSPTFECDIERFGSDGSRARVAAGFAPAVDGESGRIAYLTYDGQLVITDADGALLGSTPSDGTAMDWSPSGHRLAVGTADSITTFDPATMLTEELTSTFGRVVSVSWERAVDQLPSFLDIAGNTHANSIAAAHDAEITAGCDRLGIYFCPHQELNRAQAATILVRALGLPASGVDAFSDDGSAHEPAINSIAAAGITNGCAPGRFCPTDPVARGQIAALLARALDLEAPSTDTFVDDDGNLHEAAIEAIAAAGVTEGCAPDRFCPAAATTRAQMMTFIVRAVDVGGGNE